MESGHERKEDPMYCQSCFKTFALEMGLIASTAAVAPVLAQERFLRTDTLTATVSSMHLERPWASEGLNVELPVTTQNWYPVDSSRWSVHPVTGLTGAFTRGFMSYAGFRLRIPVSRAWQLEPGTGVGRYQRNDDKNLGGPLEFRSGFRVWYVGHPGEKIGVELYHISNASIYRNNPGLNGLVIIHAFDLPQPLHHRNPLAVERSTS
jgi:hypothetical protein